MSLKTKRIYEFGAFRLDAAERLLFQNGNPLPLPPKVLDTLLVLVENNGRLIEKEELLKLVWPDTFVEENNLNKNVSALRKALGEGLDEQKFIETVPKRGYRFIADVSQHQDGGETEWVIERSKARVLIEEEQETDEAEDEAGLAQPVVEEARFEKALTVGSHSQRKPWWKQRKAVLAMTAALLGIALIVTAFLLIWKKPNQPVPNGPVVRTIAVLPFQPISAEGRDMFLELGMADALITKLSNLKQVIVRPTSSVRKYAGLNQDPVVAGQDLKVGAVLVGNVQKLGEMLRVTVQLINVEDGRSLWAEKFDTKFTDIFTVQDAISERVAGALTLKLTGEEREQLIKRYTQDDEAYELYQKGRYFLDINTEVSIREAINNFKQATERDPNYALAYSGITEAYIRLGRTIGGVSKEEVSQAKAAAARALTLDDTLAEAHLALGDIQFTYEWDRQKAQSEYTRAIQLNPNDADAHASYASYLVTEGRQDEALAESKRAVELNPLSTQINMDLTVTFIAMHQYDDAIVQIRKTAELNPDYISVQAMLGRVYILKGMYEEAIAQYQKVLVGGQRRSAVVGLAQAYARTGRREEAQKLLDEIKAQSDGHRVQYYYVAIVQTALGDRDAAFESLKKGLAARELGMLYLKLEARFDDLHSDPRFAELLRSAGLTP